MGVDVISLKPLSETDDMYVFLHQAMPKMQSTQTRKETTRDRQVARRIAHTFETILFPRTV